MAGAISAANIRLGADISGLLSGLSSASSSVKSFTYKINTDLTNAYKRADTANKVFRGGLTRLGNEIQDIGGKMSLFGTLPALFAAGAVFKTYADLQKLKIGLEQYGESMATVKKLATLPNISIEGAAESLVQLRAVGVQSDLAQRAIRSFANALTAAGKSSTDLNPALSNVVQMLSTGAVSAADVKELANRIPQARKALMDAFGTASGEELTKIGSEKVILGLIEQLEKIPPVAGGAGMALEKFGDSAQFAAATLGETIDKTFNVTAHINSLADALGGIVDDFAGLDSKVQTFLLSAGAMAVAVPAVTIAIGAMISAAVAAAAALGVAAGTVGLVAAAVAAGGALIITYWDEIKSFLTETGVWTTLVDLAESTWGIISNVFKSAGALLSGDWSRLWTGLRNIVASAINALNTVLFGFVKQIGLAVGAIAQLVGADSLGKWIRDKSHGLDGVLKQLKIAQQRNSKDSVVNSNDYGKQFASDDAQSKAWEEQQARLAKMKPAADLATLSVVDLKKKLEELKDAHDSLKPGEKDYIKNKASIISQTKQITSLIDKQGAGLKEATKHAKESDSVFKKMTSSAYALWQVNLESKWAKERQELKETIKSYKELVGVTANLTLTMLRLKPLDINGITGRISDTVQGGLDRAKRLGSSIADYRMPRTGSSIDKQTANSFFEKNTRDLAALDLKSAFGSRIDFEGLKSFFADFSKSVDETKEQYQDRIGAIVRATGKLKESFGSAFSLENVKAFFKELPQVVGAGAEAYEEKLNRIVDATAKLNEDLTQMVVEIKTSLGASLGEAIGDAVSGAEGGMKNLGKNILAIFADILGQLGKALIAYAATVTTAKIAMKTLNPYLAAAAGIAAIAASKILKNNLTKQPKFAKGGFAYGEMSATVGDNPNARFDPEMIAPYSKVDKSIKQSIKESNSGSGYELGPYTIEIPGDKLRIVLERSQQNRKGLLAKY